MVNLAVERITVDIFSDVFGDIASRAAFVQVLGFKPVLCCTALIAVFLQRIPSHDVDYLLALFTLAEQHHMPVRRTVMVRFNDTHTVNAQAVIFKRGAHFAPDAHQITLAVFWGENLCITIVVKLDFFSPLLCQRNELGSI